MRKDSPFSTIKIKSEECKEEYKTCIDVFNTQLSQSLFCINGCDMNYNYSWMETHNGNKVQSPHVDFSEDENSHGNFFNVIIPLTISGCYIYVWPVFAHMDTSRIAGKLVFIEYGKGFVIPSNIVHAGGISVEGTYPRVGIHVTRNSKFALSPSYSTRTKVLIQGTSYEYSSSYFVKEVIPNKGVEVDEWVAVPRKEDEHSDVSEKVLV